MCVGWLVGRGRFETCPLRGFGRGGVVWWFDGRASAAGIPLRSCVGLLGSASPFAEAKGDGAGRKGTLERCPLFPFEKRPAVEPAVQVEERRIAVWRDVLEEDAIDLLFGRVILMIQVPLKELAHRR